MRLNLLVEGQSEEAFVNQVLAGHLRDCGLVPRVRLLTTRGSRGGVSTYSRIRQDLQRWFREDPDHECRFTTLIDAYGLPGDFPKGDAVRGAADPYARVRALEDAFMVDLQESRFLAHLQLHEFEALLLSEPKAFAGMYPQAAKAIKTLERVRKQAGGPERVNLDSPPSHRIRLVLPGYRKVVAAAQVADRIGLERMRAACPHFDEWVKRLEGLRANL